VHEPWLSPEDLENIYYPFLASFFMFSERVCKMRTGVE
jgi:hypothetical protein